MISAFDTLRASPEFDALTTASARLGRDPLQVQGPGGNTSLKQGGAMWIKASGTWLAEADTREIMVPVDAAALRAAVARGEAPDDACVVHDRNGVGLRASIETSVHAVLDWPVVLHTHCVATLALAVCADAEARLAQRLEGVPWRFIPYVKPGFDLAAAIVERVTPETRVLVLGNHGLVVCGPTVAEAEAMLRAVSARLEPDGARTPPEASRILDAALTDSGWRAAPPSTVHALAHDPALIDAAGGATLYPDHLIFLGPGIAVAAPDETAQAAARRCSKGGARRKLVLIPGRGAALPADATPAMKAMARCLGDVVTRIAPGAALARLTTAQEYDLLNWDAEKHRQALDRAEGAA